MARCARSPRIFNHLAAATPVRVELRAEYSRWLIQVRENVAATLSFEGDERNLFTLRAGSTYSEENVKLDRDRVLLVSVAAGSTVEVWTWDA